jgi:hypothetical protein
MRHFHTSYNVALYEIFLIYFLSVKIFSVLNLEFCLNIPLWLLNMIVRYVAFSVLSRVRVSSIYVPLDGASEMVEGLLE